VLHLASDSPAGVRRRGGLRYSGRHRVLAPTAKSAGTGRAETVSPGHGRGIRIALAAATGLAALLMLVPAAPVAAGLLGAAQHRATVHPATGQHPATVQHRAAVLHPAASQRQHPARHHSRRPATAHRDRPER
jgi:hypothetical protein